MIYFDERVACEIGMNGAIILENIRYWVKKNAVNDVNKYDGKYWTFNSIPAFCKMFPFISQRTIARELKKLKEDGYIEVSNHNRAGYDKTNWYALTDKAIALIDDIPVDNPVDSDCQIGTMDNDKLALSTVSDCHDGQCQIGTMDNDKLARPIPRETQDNTIQENTQENLVVVVDARAREDAEVGECVATYEQNIRPICGAIEQDMVLALITDYGAEWFKAAVKQAVLHNARSVSYIEGILKNWQAHGQTTKPARAAPRAKPTMQDDYEQAMAIIREGGFAGG